MSEIMQKLSDKSQSAVREVRTFATKFWNWAYDDGFVAIVVVPLGLIAIAAILFAWANPGAIVTTIVNTQ